MKDCIWEKFVELWNACQGLPAEERASQFAATKGEKYDQNKIKLLLVGRAPNGWNLTDKDHLTLEDMAKRAHDRLYKNPECGSWVEKKRNALYAKGQSYRLGAFWNYAKEIWLYLQPDGFTEDADTIWLENIAWSNLYKLSPAAGNPSDESKSLQNEICRKMLLEEVDALKPTHILMMTGWDGWAENFKVCFDEDFKPTGQRNICRGNNRNGIYVEKIGRINGVPTAVLCRPEFREKKLYVEAAEEALRKFK